MDDNPWLVDSIHSFSFFKCPECIFDSKEEENFHDHAIQNHPLSFVFFGKPGVEMITEEKSTDLPEKIEVLKNSFEVEDNESSFEMEHNENSFEVKYNEDSFEDTEMKTDVKKETFEGSDAHDKVGIDYFKSQDFNHPAIKSKTFRIKTEFEAVVKEEHSNEPEKLNTDIIEYSCKYCLKMFKYFKSLKKHEETHALLNCKTLNEDRNDSGSLIFKEIMVIRNEKFRYNKTKKLAECQIKDCGKIISCLNGKSAIGIHLGTEHNIYDKNYIYNEKEKEMKIKQDTFDELKVNIYQCEMCNSDLKSKRALLMHVKTIHQGEKLLLCKQCNFTGSKPYEIQIHVAKVHEGKKSFKCHICNYCSDHAGNLLSHIRKGHEGNKTHQCNICAKFFHQRNGLKLHIEAVHEGKKTYQCTFCGKTFGFKSTLSTHIVSVHEGKLFECDRCDNKFTQKGNLRIHIATVHEKKRPFACEICGKSFQHKNVVKRHLKLVHKNC
jgi:hypothetical protein